MIRAPFADRDLADGHLIDLRDVVKDYVTDAGPFRALSRSSLQVDRGEFIARRRPVRLRQVDADEHDHRHRPADVRRRSSSAARTSPACPRAGSPQWRGRTVGVIFQFFQLLPTLTVVENVMLPMDFAGLWTPRERQQRAMHLLELVGSRTRRTSSPRRRPAASSSAPRSRARSPTTRR